MKYIFQILLGAFLLVQCNSVQQKASTESTTKVEEKAPAATVPIYASFDEMAHIFEYKNDTTYIINFWATWCKPCVEELPYFEDIHTKYADAPVKVILVSLDFKKQIEKKLLPFIQDRNLQPEVLALVDNDANTWIPKVEEEWDGAIPVTVIYKNEKRKFIGRQFDSHDELESILKTFF